MNVLVTGSREFAHLEMVAMTLEAIQIDRLFVGDARGPDREAVRVFRRLTGRKSDIFRADWTRYSRGAGPLRNLEMINAFITAGGGIVLAFWDGKSPGTRHCMREAARRGLAVWTLNANLEWTLFEDNR